MQRSGFSNKNFMGTRSTSNNNFGTGKSTTGVNKGTTGSGLSNYTTTSKIATGVNSNKITSTTTKQVSEKQALEASENLRLLKEKLAGNSLSSNRQPVIKTNNNTNFNYNPNQGYGNSYEPISMNTGKNKITNLNSTNSNKIGGISKSPVMTKNYGQQQNNNYRGGNYNDNKVDDRPAFNKGSYE
jgi:hypothetical protein